MPPPGAAPHSSSSILIGNGAAAGEHNIDLDLARLAWLAHRSSTLLRTLEPSRHVGSRWNPTKEQINMLEGLYRQGLRTPTAEQIQQITSRLQEHGHIQGKNVFYWFQNHKARQRQKQKQESFAYYNASPPLFSPYHSVVCSPCYIPPVLKNDSIFYNQYPKVQLPTAAATFKRSRLTPETTDQPRNQNPTWSQRYNTNPHQETLDLFPIHPTGILQSRNDHENKNPRISCTTPSMSNADNGGEDDDDDENDGHYPFF